MIRFTFFVLFLLVSPSFAFAHGMTDADKQAILNAGYLEYLSLGAKHMLTGYDHLLFLFGVIFFLTSFKGIVKFVTAFTLGHCITLIFATLLQIQANYFLIDAVIALTVVYKGFDNLDGFKKYLNVESPNLVGMVFAFGLIHGFGLSTRLQQLPLGEMGSGLILRILSFNVGVEVGQVLALAVMLFLLSGWRSTASFKKFGNASNVGLITVGLLLLLMQLHGYQHTKYPDEFPINQDDHSHIHQKLTESSAVKPSESPAMETYTVKEDPIPPAAVPQRAKGHDHGDGNIHHH